EGDAAHGRAAGADLLADPRQPARPGRNRLHAPGAPAGSHAGGDVEAHLRRDAREGAVRRRLVGEADHDRPPGPRADRARLGPVPGVGGQGAPLPARRRPRAGRHRRAERGRRADDLDVRRPFGPAAADDDVRPRLRTGTRFVLSYSAAAAALDELEPDSDDFELESDDDEPASEEPESLPDSFVDLREPRP